MEVQKGVAKMKKVLIPDEFIVDYSISEEERKEQADEYREKAEKAWDELLGDEKAR